MERKGCSAAAVQSLNRKRGQNNEPVWLRLDISEEQRIYYCCKLNVAGFCSLLQKEFIAFVFCFFNVDPLHHSDI